MEPIFELPLRLPPKGSRKLLQSLHRELRGAIIDGRLQSGLRLPPTRQLAIALGVSRNTVVAAYDLLLSEGYLEGRQGAGTYVADVRPKLQLAETHAARPSHDRRLAPFWRTDPAPGPVPPRHLGRFDFRTGYPDTTVFPFDIWQRLSARAARGFAKLPTLEYEPQGRSALREAIANHISFARAVACHPEDIVVTTGTRQAVDLIARILITPGETRVAIEDPCYPPLRMAFAIAGARIVSVAVDAEGLQVQQLPAGTRVICVAPSHQYPLGVAMSASRRAALLEFARAHDAVIIEDDYDSEFRLDGRPLDALQVLDRDGCVFYVGTFAKSMFNAMRVGFAVAPPWARRALVAAKQAVDGSNPTLVQDALASFISEGHLARHVRKMRRIYGERHAALLGALDRHCKEQLRPLPSFAGVHLAAEITVEIAAFDVAAAAAGDGITVETLGRYAFGRSAPNGLVFGYGMIEAKDIDPGVRKLSRVLDRLGDA